MVIGAQILEGVPHIGQDLTVREFLLLLDLRDGVAGARDFALIAVEDGKLNLSEERSKVEAVDMRVVDLRGDVLLADSPLQLVLAVCGGHTLLRGEQVRTTL